MDERIRKVAMMIADEGPGEVDSEESSVDSDEAWEEGGSDDERWGDVFRDLEKGRGKKGKGKAKEVVRKVSAASDQRLVQRTADGSVSVN
jgi:U3 small nucleolar RNA-associated protein 14